MLIKIPQEWLVRHEEKISYEKGLCLVSFFSIPMPMLYNWQSVSVSGTTKRIIFNSVFQMAYGIGNIIGPMTYSVSPDPKTPMIIMIVLFGLNGIFIICISFIHYVWNNHRNALAPILDVINAEEQLRINLSDLTDKKRPMFRYPY